MSNFVPVSRPVDELLRKNEMKITTLTPCISVIINFLTAMTTTMTFSLIKLLLVCCVFVCTINAQQRHVGPHDAFYDDEDSTAGDGSWSSSFSQSTGDKNNYNIPKARMCSCVPLQLCSNKRRNDDPCESIHEVCCDKESHKEQPVKTTPPAIKKKGCGHRQLNGQFEFPWMVAVLREETINEHLSLEAYQCGGALIHPQVIVTVAHCVSDTEKKYKVRAGDFDYTTTKEIYPHQERTIENIIRHYDYQEKGLLNDIALLYLKSPFDMAENVDTICLPPQGKVFNSTSACYVTNWGIEKHLTKTIDRIISSDKCELELRKTTFGKDFNLNESFLCTRAKQRKNGCEIYRGSPLACPITGQFQRYQQIGISVEPFRCEDKYPGVYVNLSLFRDWIDERMENLGLDTDSYEY